MNADSSEGAPARFSSAEAQSNRVIVGRLLPGADLIGGLEAVCDAHGVTYAAVAFAYGSLSSAGFKVLRIRPETGPRPVLTLTTVDRRVEFLGGQGLICDDGNGGRATHLHGSISDETGQVLGGHFEPGMNPIYNNLDFTLTELVGVTLSRAWDAETQTVEMIVRAKEHKT